MAKKESLFEILFRSRFFSLLRNHEAENFFEVDVLKVIPKPEFFGDFATTRTPLLHNEQGRTVYDYRSDFCQKALEKIPGIMDCQY